MGQKNAKNIPKPEIQLTYTSRILNLYTIPKTFTELEDIAYNFYYSLVETLHPYEYLNLTYNSRGFLRQTITINDKRSYKSAMKIVTKGTLQIEILPKANERLFTFKLKKIEDHAVKNAAYAIKQQIDDNKEVFVEVFSAYSKMLKISNYYSQFISAHDTTSSLFAIFSLILSDSSKSNLTNKFTVIDSWPYIVLNSEHLSENSSNTLRIWNDFTYYLEKALNITSIILAGFENAKILITDLTRKDSVANKYFSSFKKVNKFIETFKIVQRRLTTMHDKIRSFAESINKEPTLAQLACISDIIQSCGANGSENFMNLFGITPINKFFLN